jgi:hypothetical protein
MTASLPQDVQATFDRFITTEYTTIDRTGQPIVWPVTPYYRPGDPTIDVTTGIGYPKKANDARANPRVALLFSDPTGSGLDDPPMVLVQGTADVDDRDLAANQARYARESLEKLPGTKSMQPPAFLHRFMRWYYARIYVHVRPERVYVWPEGDATREPVLHDCHMEEVRSGHSEEPEVPLAPPRDAPPVWDERMDELGTRYPAGVLAIVAPDGFPFAVRLPIATDRDARRIRFTVEPTGVPLQPCRACLVVHDHPPDFTWQRNFQVRGDLVEEEDGSLALVPEKLVGGFELPPGSALSRLKLNAGKARRYQRTARAELRRRRERARAG